MPAFQGNGTTIEWAAAPANLFAEIVNISMGGRSKDVIDVSTFATTGTREKIMSTLAEGGQVTVDILFAPGIDPDAVMAATGNAVITYTSDGGDVWTMPVGCSGLSGELPFHDRATQQVQLEVLGATVLT